MKEKWMEIIFEKAPAKVNLALDVVGILPNGYHEMAMINHSTELWDELSFQPYDTIRLTCDHGMTPQGESNVIVQVAKKIQEEKGVSMGVHIHLKKKIPMEAGLGGGSADAAATIRGLNRLWKLGMTVEEMIAFGVKIGADVPYCINNGTALVKGIGEKITLVKPLPTWNILIVKPEISIKTPWAFQQVDREADVFHPSITQLLKIVDNNRWEELAQHVGNSFEKPIFAIYPEIKKLKQRMEKELNADFSIMSGSGSTIIGYYFKEAEAIKALSILKSEKYNVFLSHIK